MNKIIKKIILVLVVIICCSCNYQIIDMNYNYKKVHFYSQNQCYELVSWRDYEDGEQLQVEIKGYGKVLTSSYNCLLVEEKCPICD